MDVVEEIKGLLKQHKQEITALLKQHQQQNVEHQRKLGAVFEALDRRLVIMENAIVVCAGDVSQARHNTHQINNLLQTLVSNQELIFTHFGISPDALPRHPLETHVTPR